MKTCATCNHYRPTEDVGTTGTCRLFPPTVVFVPPHEEMDQYGMFSMFPEVDAEEYCGQWEGEEQ